MNHTKIEYRIFKLLRYDLPAMCEISTLISETSKTPSLFVSAFSRIISAHSSANAFSHNMSDAFFLFQNIANASVISRIINNFELTENMKFDFVQTIDGKIEKGECIIVYPKKIYCEYIDFYNKILVSNGKSLVINSDKNNQYYRYPLVKTPLNLILDKKFIISKIYKLKEDSNYPFYYVFNLDYENNLIKVFFNKNDLNLIGWETKDVYQNIVQTFISDIEKNISVDDKIFRIQNYTN